MTKTEIRLTAFSHGAGCGCKLSPAVLKEILSKNYPQQNNASLILGNQSADDASVTDIGGNEYLLATTDFFMPIVDDPFLFGKIAATNALSDIYAMGGRPVAALAILGWPIDKLSPEIAGIVLQGAREACAGAGIQIGGGHSIDCPEPIFGLAVNGLVSKEKLKTNAKAETGDALFLTKPLGVGIYSTAEKKGILDREHSQIAHNSMTQLNLFGEIVSSLPQVHAMTDITGFGLGGHLLEMCVASQKSAEIWFNNLVQLPHLKKYVQEGAIPGGTNRNYQSSKEHIGTLTDFQKAIVFDPQTSGGLLIALDKEYVNEFAKILHEYKLSTHALPIGNITPLRDGQRITIVD